MKKYTQAEVLQLWQDFANIPINKDAEIETAFLHFVAYTDKFEIWHWFDDNLENGLVKDVMNGKVG